MPRYTKVGSESYTKTDKIHFCYDADGKPSQAVLTDMIENPNEYIWIERDAFSYPIK